MEDKKDIGKTFKEKLDGLQKTPGDAVWQSLSADLDKRRKHRKASFWFRFLGIAFVVLITATVIALNVWETKTTPPAVQNTEAGTTALPSGNNEATNTGTPSEINNNTIINNDTNNNQGNSSNDNSISNPDSTDSKGYVNNNPNPGNDSRRAGTNSNANTPSTGKVKKAESNNGVNPIKTNTKKSGYAKNSGSAKNANTNNPNPTTTYNNPSAKAKTLKKSSIGTIAGNSQSGSGTVKKYGKENAGSPSAKNTAAQEETASNRLLTGSSQPSSNNKNEGVNDGKNATSNTNKDSSSTLPESKVSNVDNTRTTTDKVLASGTDIETKNIGTIDGQLTGNDTIKPADSLKIEKPVAEEEKKSEEKKKTDSIHPPDFRRWYFAVNAGPSKYTFPSNKSIIDSRLDDNSVDIKSTFNYGAYIGYRFNAKWGVRLGINSTKFEQVTKNAYLLNEEQQAEDFEHINYAATQATPDPPPNPGDPPPVFSQGNEAIIEKLGAYADITVKITYIEIPAEVTFHAFGNRLGADITAGFSTLFISKNTVYASNDLGSVYMGTLDSKKMSFSTNAGLRFYYQFIPSLQFNVEPAFRYYLNTFDNVKPYSLNLQAGLQYNFNIGKKKQ